QSEAPDVRVVLHDMSTDEMLRGLHSGKLHVALMVNPGPKQMRGLVFEELCRYPICAALPNDHKLARGKTVDLRQIAGEPLVAYSRAEYPEYHEMLAGLFAPVGGLPPIAEEHDSATSLI